MEKYKMKNKTKDNQHTTQKILEEARNIIELIRILILIGFLCIFTSYLNYFITGSYISNLDIVSLILANFIVSLILASLGIYYIFHKGDKE